MYPKSILILYKEYSSESTQSWYIPLQCQTHAVTAAQQLVDVLTKLLKRLFVLGESIKNYDNPVVSLRARWIENSMHQHPSARIQKHIEKQAKRQNVQGPSVHHFTLWSPTRRQDSPPRKRLHRLAVISLGADHMTLKYREVNKGQVSSQSLLSLSTTLRLPTTNQPAREYSEGPEYIVTGNWLVAHDK